MEESDLASLAKVEIDKAELSLAKIELDIYDLLRKKPEPETDLILETHQGVGGDDAALFARELKEAYMKILKKLLPIYQSDTLTEQLLIPLNLAYIFEFETGIHRVQRIPVNDLKGRVHTSTVSVTLLPFKSDFDVNIDESVLRIDVYRSQGAGGQSVNKVNSAVRIVHLPTGITVTNQDQRHFEGNKIKAMEVLKIRLSQNQYEKATEIAKIIRNQQSTISERAYRIRTYNFMRNSLQDHRLKTSFHKCSEFLEGNANIYFELYNLLSASSFENKIKQFID